MAKARSSLHDSPVSKDDQAKLLTLFATEGENVRRVAMAEGFPAHVVDKFLKTMRKSHVGVGEAVKALGHAEMISVLTEKMSLALAKIDSAKLDASGARDIAIVFGILAEKRELLQGKPTQIFSFEERQKMPELLASALREAGRRGITIDASSVEVKDEIMPRLINGDKH